MNPYTILAAVLLAIALWFGGDHVGHKRGVNEQKVADQVKFDDINNKLTDQKAEANAAYRSMQEHNLALVVDRDQLKTNLEKEHETNRATTDALRVKLAGVGLRFATSQSSGLGDRCAGAGSAGTDSASSATATVIQLPDLLGRNLRQLVYNSDVLADNYRECYGYASKVR